MPSRVLQFLLAGLLFGAVLVGALLGLSGLLDLIREDVVRLSRLGEIVVGFGVASVAGTLAFGYARGAFARNNRTGAA